MSTTVMFVLAGAAAILLALMLKRMVKCCREIRSYRRDVNQRMDKLRIHKMLDKLGINRSRYFSAIKPATTEQHLFICERCPKPDTCDQYLEDDGAADPASFCPNHTDFEKLKRKRPAS